MFAERRPVKAVPAISRAANDRLSHACGK